MHPQPGWVNSDQKAGPGIDISCDVREGLPLADASFDYVVSIHALPEVPWPDLVPTLRELRRVLRPGGTLRLALPDLERAIAAYQRGDREYFLIPDDDMRSIGGKLVTQLVWYGYSRTLFTVDFVDELLGKAGFAAVRECAYRTTSCGHEAIIELDNRERESLFIEAVR
jgi:SAM-dependent methyltransferase